MKSRASRRFWSCYAETIHGVMPRLSTNQAAREEREPALRRPGEAGAGETVEERKTRRIGVC